MLLRAGIAAFVLNLWMPLHAAAQYENLVFEGAGIRGIAYSGVIKVLEEDNILTDIKKVGGTSAGAITALMVALGYSADSVDAIVKNTPFQKFNDGKWLFAGGIYRSFKYYGWYRKRAFSKWLEHWIVQKTGNSGITFAQLEQAGFKSLYVTGTCLNRQKLLVFSAETYPDMQVKDAVCISMSIPLYFEAGFIDEKGNLYRSERIPPNADIVIDGGFVGNFPIFLFDRTDSSVQPPRRIANSKTIGIRIDEPQQILLDKDTTNALMPVHVYNFKRYLGALYIFIIENLNRNTLTSEDWARTISVSSEGIGPRIKKLTMQEKQKLISSGEAATRNFLKANN